MSLRPRPSDVLAVAAGVATFLLGLEARDDTGGVAMAALASAIVAAATWFLWWRILRGPSPRRVVGALHLGDLPEADVPAPVLSAPTSREALAYHRLLTELESRTTGRVIPVAAATPGQGATTVAMNLAMAATRAGRRVLLVDADASGLGLSRFLGTGPEPGLAELASDDVGLATAARMWRLDETNLLPMVPVGGSADADLGAALDRVVADVGDRADLVLIDLPPVLWNGGRPPVPDGAAGTLLVIPTGAPTEPVRRAVHRLTATGAPPLGWVRTRVPRGRLWASAPVRALKRGMAVLALVVVAYGALTAFGLARSWSGVARQSFDVTAAEAALVPLGEVAVPELETSNDVEVNLEETTAGLPTEGDDYLSFLLIGSDEAGGAADVIIYLVAPADGRDPFMVSLPRDLYLPNRCTGGYSRINATIHGCGDEINGPTLLALTVEDFTGIPVDHFARFDFEGFARIIDGVGGIEICVDNPVLDTRSELRLPAGCTVADGDQALAWVRSRHTLEKIGGRWRTVPGAGDLMRNARQQDVVLQLFRRLKDFESPADLAAKVEELTDAFTLDDRLGLTDAISLAWTFRDLDPSRIRRLEVPVELTRTKEGKSVLVPLASFDELLSAAYADAEAGSTVPPG